MKQMDCADRLIINLSGFSRVDPDRYSMLLSLTSAVLPFDISSSTGLNPGVRSHGWGMSHLQPLLRPLVGADYIGMRITTGKVFGIIAETASGSLSTQ